MAAHPVAGGGREDCWSEGATASLVEAWGDRYLLLNRGNLRQKDWSDVANAVNGRQELLGRPRKTDVQCKNRIDTVKKKYKSERAKSGPSTWPFFAKLDYLVGNGSSSSGAKKPSDLRLPALTFPVKRRNAISNPNPNLGVFPGGSSSRLRMFQATAASSESSGEYENDDEDQELDDEDDDVDDGEDRKRDERLNGGLKSEKKRRWDGLVGCGGGGGGGGGGEVGGVGDLARAIVKFAEVYERVESEKQKQVMEMERQRMEFTKEVEFQRMKLFMEAQLEVEKMKRPKYSSGSGKRI